VLATLLAAIACDDGQADSDKVQVVTTLPLFADVIENVGGDRVDVAALLPSGADPHTWEPSPQDAKKVADADIVFVNGLALEPTALSIVEANIGEDVAVVAFAENVEPVFQHAGNDHLVDPHLWMDPDNAKAYAGVIRDRLMEVDSEGADSYAANLEVYAAEIDAEGEYLEAAADRVPDERRKLITTHDAFGYLAGHMGFEIEAFVAAGPGSEASPDDIAAIVSAVEEQDIPAVFTEPQVDSESETLAQIAQDTGARVCTLYSDALDDEVTSYIEMMRFNADEIARCLGGGDGG